MHLPAEKNIQLAQIHSENIHYQFGSLWAVDVKHIHLNLLKGEPMTGPPLVT
jgi:hypothetical protein